MVGTFDFQPKSGEIREIGNLYGKVMSYVQIFKKMDCFMVGHNSGQKNVLLYGQQIECPDQKTGHCQKWVALWSGPTECPDLVSVMVGHNSVQKFNRFG